MTTKQKQLMDFLGVDSLTEKSILVNGKTFTVRVPTMGEMIALSRNEDRSATNDFILSLIKEFPPEIKWVDVLEMPSSGSKAITDLLNATMSAVVPAAEDVSGN